MSAQISYLKDVIRREHYTHSVPSGKSHYFSVDGAIVVFSIPANNNISGFLGCDKVWELSRLWAPDNHEPNLLTRAIARSVANFRVIEPTCDALVSYADPNVGHEGFVYRAASWVFLGQCEESRVYYRDGEMRSRRAFHSGRKSMTKMEIEALGWVQKNMPGKFRFARGLTKRTRREILKRENRFMEVKR